MLIGEWTKSLHALSNCPRINFRNVGNYVVQIQSHYNIYEYPCISHPMYYMQLFSMEAVLQSARKTQWTPSSPRSTRLQSPEVSSCVYACVHVCWGGEDGKVTANQASNLVNTSYHRLRNFHVSNFSCFNFHVSVCLNFTNSPNGKN